MSAGGRSWAFIASSSVPGSTGLAAMQKTKEGRTTHAQLPGEVAKFGSEELVRDEIRRADSFWSVFSRMRFEGFPKVTSGGLGAPCSFCVVSYLGVSP